MVNVNGRIVAKSNAFLNFFNRGFTYGDAVFETIKVNSERPIFWEAHYFRLMASMRMLRMDIPMHFTPEFLESEIISLVKSYGQSSLSYRVKLYVHRKPGGLYTPSSNEIEYAITIDDLSSDLYIISEDDYEVELFKDYLIAPNLLSTLKTNNKIVNVVGSIFAKENNYANCFLLNTNKHVIEALNGNLFLVQGNTIKTPPITDGCLKGIIRQKIIDIIKSDSDLTLEEVSISAFELQKSDEIFITNVVCGIQPVTKYRKKRFDSFVSKSLLNKLNIKLRLD